MKKGIGGSDIGVITGENEYQTPYDLWLYKTGQKAKEPLAERQLLGLELEPVILRLMQNRFPEYGFVKNEQQFTDKLLDFLVCVPDSRYPNGILSIKNTSRKIEPDDELPKYWITQANWEMGILGVNEGLIAWLERGSELKCRSVAFDPEYFEYQVTSAVDFWTNYVLTNTPPPPRTEADVLEMFPKATLDKSIQANKDILELWKRLGYITKQIKPLESEKKAISEQIKIAMGDAEFIVNELGRPLFSFKNDASKKVLDETTLKESYPELYSSLLIEKVGPRKLLAKLEKEK